LVDMGLVYDVRVRGATVQVTITMPHEGRPVYEFFVTQGGGRVEEGIRERLQRLPGVRDVVVDFTRDPPWTVNRLTDDGRKALGLTI
ncbi:MAG: iron-sulfur cluster assembly protein, partial [Longimicrobiales bacterium]